MVNVNMVDGSNNKHEIMLYALSTCVWCKKTRNLLDSLDVSYKYVYVDQLSSREELEIMEEIMNYNPNATFPTITIDNDIVIVGFREDQIRKALS